MSSLKLLLSGCALLAVSVWTYRARDAPVEVVQRASPHEQQRAQALAWFSSRLHAPDASHDAVGPSRTEAPAPQPLATVDLTFCSAESDVLRIGWFALDRSGEHEQIQASCRERTTHRFALAARDVAFVVARVDDDSPRYAAERFVLTPGEHRQLDLRSQTKRLRPNMIELVGEGERPVRGATVAIEAEVAASDAGLLRWVNQHGTSTDERGVFLLLTDEGPLTLLVRMPGLREPSRLPFVPGQGRLTLPSVRTAVCHFREVSGEDAPYGHVYLEAEHSTERQRAAEEWEALSFAQQASRARALFAERSDDSEGETVSYPQLATAVRSGDYAFAWPHGAAQVRVDSPGFRGATLGGPDAPCDLVRQPQ